MAEGKVYIYGGKGHGKSPAAIGCGLIAAAKGARVVIIQFLKGKGLTEDEYPRRLEPGIKLSVSKNPTKILWLFPEKSRKKRYRISEMA